MALPNLRYALLYAAASAYSGHDLPTERSRPSSLQRRVAIAQPTVTVRSEAAGETEAALLQLLLLVSP